MNVAITIKLLSGISYDHEANTTTGFYKSNIMAVRYDSTYSSSTERITSAVGAG